MGTREFLVVGLGLLILTGAFGGEVATEGAATPITVPAAAFGADLIAQGLGLW